MSEIGTRVATNVPLMDQDHNPVAVNEVGMVIGHQGPYEIVELNNGESWMGDKRQVVALDRHFRKVQVAHPGQKRRSRPRRYNDGEG